MLFFHYVIVIVTVIVIVIVIFIVIFIVIVIFIYINIVIDIFIVNVLFYNPVHLNCSLVLWHEASFARASEASAI